MAPAYCMVFLSWNWKPSTENGHVRVAVLVLAPMGKVLRYGTKVLRYVGKVLVLPSVVLEQRHGGDGARVRGQYVERARPRAVHRLAHRHL